MARRHVKRIRAELDLSTVVHLHDHTAFKDVAGVRRLARRRAGDRHNVLRPTPSGFEDSAAKGLTTDSDNLKLSLAILERAGFIALVDAMGIGDDPALRGLSGYFRQPQHRHGA